jgi:hypothetical protein
LSRGSLIREASGRRVLQRYEGKHTTLKRMGYWPASGMKRGSFDFAKFERFLISNLLFRICSFLMKILISI